MTSLTSMCEMACQIIQKKQEEKRIEEEQAANALYWKIPACCDDDNDYNSAITPNEPVDSLSMGDEHLNTSCSDKDVLDKIFSNPLFDEEINSTKIDPHHFSAESDLIESLLNHDSSMIYSFSKIDSLLDEFAGELTLLKSISPGIDETDCHPENEIHLTKRLLYDDSYPHPLEEFVSENSNADIESLSPSPIPVKDSDSFMEDIDLSFTSDDLMPPGIEDDDYDSERVPIPGIMITRVPNQEKSPDLLSHRGFKIFQPFTECSIMIHGKNIPILDVPLFYFYPLDQLNMGGIGNVKTLAKGFYPPNLHFLSFILGIQFRRLMLKDFVLQSSLPQLH
nr:hypothetical protein [Tanacetum cinerariifolium]